MSALAVFLAWSITGVAVHFWIAWHSSRAESIGINLDYTPDLTDLAMTIVMWPWVLYEYATVRD